MSKHDRVVYRRVDLNRWRHLVPDEVEAAEKAVSTSTHFVPVVRNPPVLSPPSVKAIWRLSNGWNTVLRTVLYSLPFVLLVSLATTLGVRVVDAELLVPVVLVSTIGVVSVRILNGVPRYMDHPDYHRLVAEQNPELQASLEIERRMIEARCDLLRDEELAVLDECHPALMGKAQDLLRDLDEARRVQGTMLNKEIRIVGEIERLNARGY